MWKDSGKDEGLVFRKTQGFACRKTQERLRVWFLDRLRKGRGFGSQKDSGFGVQKDSGKVEGLACRKTQGLSCKGLGKSHGSLDAFICFLRSSLKFIGTSSLRQSAIACTHIQVSRFQGWTSVQDGGRESHSAHHFLNHPLVSDTTSCFLWEA